MNILPARCVFFFHLMCFFFSPLLCPTYLPPPTLNLPPLPTYHLRTPPPLTPSPELDLWSGSSSCGAIAVELWSRSCGVGAGARAPTRPTPPRLGKMLIFYFIFVCFVWRGKQAPSSGASPELLGFGACLLQLNPATHQAPKLVRLRSLSGSEACLLQRSKLQSMRACCVATASSRAWDLAAATQQTPELVRLWSLLRCSSKLRSLLAATQ
jgi:hypothetical protein